MKALRPKLALILFGMILGALSYKGVTWLSSNPAPDRSPSPVVASGSVKWENDAVVALTKILPNTPGKATRSDGVPFSGGVYQPQTLGARARIRAIVYASSAEPNEAVVAVFRADSKLPLAAASSPTSDNKRAKIELSVDVPNVNDPLILEFRIGPGQPGTIIFNGPENTPERAISAVTVTE